MEAEKKPDAASSDDKKPATEQSVPADALEKSNDELAADNPTETTSSELGPDGKPPKKPSGIKALLKRFNVYLLLFGLVVVVALVVSVVSYLNSKKAPQAPTISTQSLTTDTLKQLANSDA